MKHKLKVTLTFHIEADDEHYGDGANADNIAQLYKQSFDKAPEQIDFLIEKEFDIQVEPE